MSSPQQKADKLVGDYKNRLSPYVKAMKDRGYFGEAARQQQQQQNDMVNDKTSDVMAKGTAATQNKGVQPAQTGIDPVGSDSSGGFNHGLDQPSGDYLSVGKEVEPDSSETSRAPDVAGANRPAPVKGNMG